MPARRILQLGDPLLRKVSAPANATEAGPVLSDLRDTLHEFQRTHGFGRGISAVQIGSLYRIIYIEMDGARHELCNPEFERLSPETFELWDDCFSFPNLMVRLRRSVALVLRYYDAIGNARRLEAAGPFSELIQHEMDHLDGILAVDRAIDRNSFMTRDEWLRQTNLPCKS
jgi:peptide deformylase